MAEEMQQQLPFEIGTEVNGRVRHLGMYGALVDIGTGQDALLHISQLAQNEGRGFEEVLQAGSEITAYVYKTRKDGYIALTMEKPPLVPWQTIKQGNRYIGEVIRIENFGIFVDFGAERPGMVHVSEMADGYVKSPGDVASVGQEVEVRVLKKSGRPRQIDLSMKPSAEEVEMLGDDADEEDDMPTSMAQAFRRAMASHAIEGRNDEGSRMKAGRSSKREFRSQQDDIIARTLRSSQS